MAHQSGRYRANCHIAYLVKNSIITNSQYGYLAGKSTESALIDLPSYILQGLTEKLHVGAIFMDLSKAFDVITHDTLKSN